MNQQAKPQPAIDLDELERQLRQVVPPRRPPANDPLAELARIVGQQDPFKSVLAQPNARGGAADAALLDALRAAERTDAPFAPPRIEPLFPDGRPSQPSVDLRPPFDEAAPRDAGSVSAADPQTAAPVKLPMGDLTDVPQHGEPVDLPPPPQRSKRGLYLAAGVIGVAAIGLASVLALGGKGGLPVPKEPPVITARPGPIKERPADPGGVEVPNQGKQILERTAEDTQKAQVIPREEQPVDLEQAQRRDAARTQIGAAAAAGAVVAAVGPVIQPGNGQPPFLGISALPQAAPAVSAPRQVQSVPIVNGQALPPGSAPRPAEPSGQAAAVAPAVPDQRINAEPRRVRSVAIRSDGTEVPAPRTTVPTQPAPVSTPPATAGGAAAAPPLRTAPDAAAPPRPRPQASTPSSASPSPGSTAAQPQPPQRIRPARPVAPPPATEAQSTVAEPQPVVEGGPIQLTPPRRVPGQQQVAAAPASTEPPAAGGGGFVVQLTAEGSEAAARSEFTRLRGRHSEVLGGLSPNIRRAEVNGNTVYRVRVGAFSRAEAVSLCERLKSSGGNCFVARN